MRILAAYNADMSGSETPPPAHVKAISTTSSAATAFEPTPPMLEVLKWFQDNDYRLRIKPLFEECCGEENPETCRIRFYRWHRDRPGFSVWWLEQAQKHFGRVLPQVHGAVFASAIGEDVGGSPADRKTYLERFDKQYRPAADAATAPPPVTVRVDVLDAMTAMLDQMQAAIPKGADCLSVPLGLPGAGDVLDVEPVEDGEKPQLDTKYPGQGDADER